MKRIVFSLFLAVSACNNMQIYPVKLVDPVGVTANTAQTKEVNVTVASTGKSIAVKIKNKTTEPIKIDWDSVSYINESGQANRVMHTGVKYIARDQPLPATVIPAGSELVDEITPVQNVHFVSGQYGGWQAYPLLSAQSVGSHIQLYLPYFVNDKRKDLTLRMLVEPEIVDTRKAELWGSGN
jgi:hypothetical protein